MLKGLNTVSGEKIIIIMTVIKASNQTNHSPSPLLSSSWFLSLYWSTTPVLGPVDVAAASALLGEAVGETLDVVDRIALGAVDADADADGASLGALSDTSLGAID